MAPASLRDVAATTTVGPRHDQPDLGGGSVPRTHIAVLGTGAPTGRDERPCCASRRTSSITADHRGPAPQGAARPAPGSAVMTTPNVRVIAIDEERCALPCDTQAV